MHALLGFVSNRLPRHRPARPGAWSAVGASVGACLFAAVNGGCGADVGGGGVYDFPPYVRMERWESIGPSACKGWVTNSGNTAQNVRVYFWYRTPQGDTALAVAPSSTKIEPHAMVAIYAPPQITRGELRFPGLGNITWSGGSSFIGEGAAVFSYPSYTCMLSPDSARGVIRNPWGLAYDVVLNVETASGVTQVPLVQSPLGHLWSDFRNCPPGFASGCDGWGTFHSPVRDSAGVKLLPRVISVRWENYAGAVDSLNPPYEGAEIPVCQ